MEFKLDNNARQIMDTIFSRLMQPKMQLVYDAHEMCRTCTGTCQGGCQRGCANSCDAACRSNNIDERWQ